MWIFYLNHCIMRYLLQWYTWTLNRWFIVESFYINNLDGWFELVCILSLVSLLSTVNGLQSIWGTINLHGGVFLWLWFVEYSILTAVYLRRYGGWRVRWRIVFWDSTPAKVAGIGCHGVWTILSLRWLGNGGSFHMGVSENSGTPQIIHFNRVFHYKPSILGYRIIFGNTHILYGHVCITVSMLSFWGVTFKLQGK